MGPMVVNATTDWRLPMRQPSCEDNRDPTLVLSHVQPRPALGRGPMAAAHAARAAMLRVRAQDAQRQSRSLLHHEQTGEYIPSECIALEPPPAYQRLFLACAPFFARRAVPLDETTGEAATGTSRAKRLFGEKKTAADKVNGALARIEERIESLEQRAAAARASAKSAAQSGRKSEGLQCLKRAKALAASAAGLRNTATMMELQMEGVADAAMQQEVVAALSASVKKSKSHAKVLGRAEDAVESLQELSADMGDVTQVLGEMRSTSVDMDDDELMEELAMMMADEAPPAPPPTAAVVAPPQPVIDVHVFPSVPVADGAVAEGLAASR